MNEMNDDQSLLASVYLDGEATPDERAQVEASPEALAEVEALGQVRTVIGATVESASLSSREAHLAAALDVFERMSAGERRGEATPAGGVDAAAGAALTTPLSSSDTGRHRRPQRAPAQWLLGAAAAGIFLIGGAIVVRNITSNDTDNLNTAADAPALSVAAESEVEIVDQAIADSLDGGLSAPAPAASDLTNEPFSAEESTSAEGGLFETSEAGDSAESDAAAADEPPAEAAEVAPPPETDLVELDDPEALADFATLALRAVAPGATVPVFDDDFESPQGSCEEDFAAQRRAGFASYQGTTVQVGVDLVNRVAYAYTDECVEIARVRLSAEQVGQG